MSFSLVSAQLLSFKNSMGHQNWRISSTSPCLRHKVSSVSFHSRFNNISNSLEKFHDQELIIPKHVALIMDGNRRWAKAKGLPVREGYKVVTATLKELCDTCSELGIQVLTAFAFSTENWKRPKEEVDIIMQVLEELFEGCMRFGVRVSVIGNRSNLPITLQNCIALTEEATKGNIGGVDLVIAVNYGGRDEILQATKRISSKVKEGLLQLEDIDQKIFEQELGTKYLKFPNPDLIIRPAGDQRISNFLLWQLAYSEFYFTNTPFPDFGKKDLQEALLSFQRRHRKFGAS